MPRKPDIFKLLDVERKTLLRMPGNALKVWLYYWMREGKERIAWGTEKEIHEATDLNKDTIRSQRKWLVDNGWLKPMGFTRRIHGEFAVPRFRANEGTAPKISDGRSRNIPLGNATKKTSGDAAEIFGAVAAENFSETEEYTVEEDTAEEDTVSKEVSKSVGEISKPEENQPQPQNGSSAEQPQPPTYIKYPDDPDKQARWEYLNHYYGITPVRLATSYKVVGAQELMESMVACFTGFDERVIPKELFPPMLDVYDYCDMNCCYPEDVMAWVRKHKMDTPNLIPRSIKALRKALVGNGGDLVGVSTENGLMAQFKQHKEDECPVCLKDLRAKPCDCCNGPTYGSPVIEYGRVWCQKCAKLPPNQRYNARSSA